jgi:hypothetical protein
VSVDVPFDPQKRPFAGDNARVPTGLVRDASFLADSKNFMWRLTFFAFAERAILLCVLMQRGFETLRSAGTFNRNNDPSSNHGIFSKFRHKWDS